MLTIAIVTYGCLVSLSLFADTITINNRTPIDLFGAIYYTNGSCERVGKAFSLPNGKKIKTERPARQLTYDREVYFSVSKDALKRKLTVGEAEFIPHFNIGSLKGDTFYILFDEGEFIGVNKFEKAFADLIEKFENVQQSFNSAMFAPLRKSYGEYNHKNDIAEIRTDNSVSVAEQKFIIQRKLHVTRALEKLLNEALEEEDIIKIAVCASGGGYRAMTSFIGSFEGLRDNGLLDATMYLAGLSGGAWGVALATMLDEPGKQLAERINQGLADDDDEQALLKIMWKKFVFDQPLSSIDIYGGLLVQRLLGGEFNKPLELTISDQHKYIEAGQKPFPLYAAIVTKKPYEWVEFNPYEVRSTYLHAALPSWAFGSKFNQGISSSIHPEQSLGFLMGIWGSAFSANIVEMYQSKRELLPNILQSVLDNAMREEVIGDVRIFPADIHNFTHGMITSPRWQQEVLTLVDAGLDFNLPVPLVLGRADVIIIFDNSLGVLESKGGELKRVEKYAHQKKIPFPAISYDEIVKKHCSIFMDKNNPKAPLIVYFPLISNDKYSKTFDVQKCMNTSYCATANFQYQPSEVNQLRGLTHFNITDNIDVIRKALKDYIALRRLLIR